MDRRWIWVVAASCVLSVSVACSDDAHELSPDCQRTEDALRSWGATMGEVIRTPPRDVASPSKPGEPVPDYTEAARREAKAASDIRAKAGAVESVDLRARVNAVADGFDLLSRSRSEQTAPSGQYFAAITQINDALNDVVKACPGIGDPPVPMQTRPS